MNVGDLKKALEKIPDHTPVTVWIELPLRPRSAVQTGAERCEFLNTTHDGFQIKGYMRG